MHPDQVEYLDKKLAGKYNEQRSMIEPANFFILPQKFHPEAVAQSPASPLAWP